jgi:hydrogenase maturation protease
MSAVLVIGVGNRFGGDDGVGPMVIDRVRELCRQTPAIELDGEPTRLVEAWDGVGLVILIDAVCSGALPGRIHRVVVDGHHGAEELGARAAPTSSHGAGVAEAWALGTVLGRTPDRLVVLGVEGTCFEPGYGLTGAVARAVPGVARAVHEEIRAQARDSSDVSQ